jgi:hypothetical protein
MINIINIDNIKFSKIIIIRYTIIDIMIMYVNLINNYSILDSFTHN